MYNTKLNTKWWSVQKFKLKKIYIKTKKNLLTIIILQ